MVGFMSRSPDEGRSRTVLAVVTGLAVLSLLYSFLIAGQLLLGLLLTLSLFALYFLYRILHLLYRLVRAHERIATAIESRADAGRSDEPR
jgi:4-hydroxybenzoate polyprenyltransferase